MRKLDDQRDFGRVSPPCTIDGCDRPAHYEQDGLLFDAHYRQIVPGQPLAQVVPEVTAEADRAPTPAPMSPATLVAQADEMPWGAFHKEAKRILGKTCPGGKEAILAALKEAIAGYEKRQAKRAAQHKGISWDSEAKGGAEAAEAEAVAPTAAVLPVKANGKGGVDLAAWGRGQADYLAGDVFKAMRAKYHVQFSERCDAVDFLVKQGVILAAHARQDV